MGGGGRICIGIVLLGVGAMTLMIESIPVIWTGGLIVGIFMIISGLKDLATPEEYKCKMCSFTGKKEQLLRHVLLQHEDGLSETEKTSIRIALGIQGSESESLTEPSTQPASLAVEPDDDTIKTFVDEEIK